MSYQFYNDTATLKLVENGQAKNLSKSLVSLTVQGDDLVIGYDGNENWLRIAYTTMEDRDYNFSFDGTDFTQLKINGVAATDNYDLFNQFIALL